MKSDLDKNLLIKQHTLPNGLRLIHRYTSSPVAYCGYAIDAGTRDEEDHQQGMAHFVEHLLFKGTQKRRAWHILNRMENIRLRLRITMPSIRIAALRLIWLKKQSLIRRYLMCLDFITKENL